MEAGRRYELPTEQGGMPTYEGLYGRQHVHRPKKFPPQSYADLKKLEIKLLALVLAAAPPLNSPSYATFERTTMQLVAELPPHLRSKLPFLTAFCSQHRKPSPLPITSLWNAISREVDSELANVWSQSGLYLTPAQSHFIARVMQYPRFSQSHCAACSLSQLGADKDLVIALGGITLATLSPKNWRRSKRVFLLQGLLAGHAEEDQAAWAIQRMLELGSQFRELRKGRQMLDVDGRPPTSDLSQSSAQSASLVSQSDRTADGFNGRCRSINSRSTHTGVLETTTADEMNPFNLSRSTFTMPRKPVQSSARPNVFEHAFSGGDTQQRPAAYLMLLPRCILPAVRELRHKACTHR